jgi:tryptophanyl-tRNA synthetase
MVCEYSWYLSCFTGVGLLNKAHAYKDALAKNKDVNHGLFAYPVLMAADIMMYDADVVPVGKDQKQHVEFARDMAGAINALYGEGTVKAPEPLINEQVMIIPGLDGQKMSKSYNNVIPLFASDKQFRKTVLSLVTDSSALEEPKVLDGTVLGELMKLFATPSDYNELSTKLARGGYGWGHAKQDLCDAILREIGGARKIFAEIIEDRNYLDSVLLEGAAKAWQKGKPVLNRLREAMGFSARQ